MTCLGTLRSSISRPYNFNKIPPCNFLPLSMNIDTTLHHLSLSYLLKPFVSALALFRKRSPRSLYPNRNTINFFTLFKAKKMVLACFLLPNRCFLKSSRHCVTPCTWHLRKEPQLSAPTPRILFLFLAISYLIFFYFSSKKFLTFFVRFNKVKINKNEGRI